MSDAPPGSLQQLRAEWRERLRAASDRATEQVEGMSMSDLRALRETIAEEMETLEERLPDPSPLGARGAMTAEAQVQHVQRALQYNALQVRKQIVHHELRRRALGPTTLNEEVEVPSTTKQYAQLAWEVMGAPDVDTPMAVYREVAQRTEEDVHLSTVEKWLRQENPHHPEETEGSWTELRRAVLLASA